MRHRNGPWAEVTNLARQRSFRVSAIVLSSVALVTWGTIAVNAMTGQPTDPAPRPTIKAAAPATPKPAPAKPKPKPAPSPRPTAKAPPHTQAAPKPPARAWTPKRATASAPKPKTVIVPKPKATTAPKPTPKPKTLAPKPKRAPVVSYPRRAGPPYSHGQMATALMRAGATASQAQYFATIGIRETGGWNFPTTNPTGRYHGPWAMQERSNPGLDYRRLDCDLDYAARQTVALYRRAGLRPWATAY